MEDRGRTLWGHGSSCLRGSFGKGIRPHTVIILSYCVQVLWCLCQRGWLWEGQRGWRPWCRSTQEEAKWRVGWKMPGYLLSISLKIARQADGGSLSHHPGKQAELRDIPGRRASPYFQCVLQCRPCPCHCLALCTTCWDYWARWQTGLPPLAPSLTAVMITFEKHKPNHVTFPQILQKSQRPTK